MASLKSITIDPVEVAYYEKLSSTWWDKQGPFWPLHILNELRMQWIILQLSNIYPSEQPLKGLKVLDVGCGGGILSEALARSGAQVTAVDVVEKNIQIAKIHAQESGLNIDYQLTTIEQIAASGMTFDVVFNMEVVEHVACVDTFMAACNSVVKTGGIHFIASINRNWLAFMVAIIGAEYITRLLPKGTHHYKKLVKPEELATILNNNNFKVFATTGVSVNPYKRNMKLVNSTKVNYMLAAQKTR
ncbi:bifunctional 2-polyprenyl-6-hydroxyphenol methylase/3-demethylubiquinol 3-O-methyltransferase UbiG [Aliiglaciecola sp. LCG003]|uniref:bifunctional 2-polyprenyl-6-hydroxyphenol methylase/3-demethylubiquinol 3-O-methyltransferase UbiG n=1 Tax=Aliiglaciecola sp. LCG003 TaxID=3053655 RepID=UPI002573F815|nr:bifunctional 2-polyprenyl-6-hydroxyphenol methylase/3-demethylubiquinol 3-O-methyltransferase UbiG [Aliiglaciecola sp. LCG003]WJG10972.1 bifunctional 2-polyprenyl-6-hydroxyphenol methylase/3-demethylubiquinol 3-O-methyltransferase UbiG [Aliiglaciecola sp. LCG003]